MSSSLQNTCAANWVSQYIDGELEHNAAVLFERHLNECAECREELRAQRLFACELDAAFSQKPELDVPQDFSRRVAARATSDMSGVRSIAEHKKALCICLALALMGFAFLGATTDPLLRATRKIIAGIWDVIGVVAVALYDLGVSLAVIVRVVSRKLVVESGSSGYLLVVFALAVAGAASESQAARCKKKVKCGSPCGVQSLVSQSMTNPGAAKRCR